VQGDLPGDVLLELYEDAPWFFAGLMVGLLGLLKLFERLNRILTGF
jgi:hypothetical protein